MPQTEMTIQTRGQGLYEFTDKVVEFVGRQGVEEGLLTVFVRHTSCSLLIQENADPDVQRDLKTFFSRLVPPSDAPAMRWVTHTMEGPDDMPAHIRAALLPPRAPDRSATQETCAAPGGRHEPAVASPRPRVIYM